MELINIDNTALHITEDAGYKNLRGIRRFIKGKVSVVVLTYNRYEKTKQCIENLLKYSGDIPFRLILLDNGSEDQSILQLFQSVEYEDTTIVHFEKNAYSVTAVNEVFGMIDTEYVVVIANDIIVTENWLSNLLKCAEENKDAGMICPVSTNISNDQMETLGGFSSLEEMQEKAEKFNISNKNLWEEKIRLIPTATLYRSEIFDQVGKFDVGFLHDFGDDDFSFRIRRGGYKLILCRDTFVHHNHNTLNYEDKDPEVAQKLAQKGRNTFAEKYHGIDAWDDTEYHIENALGKIKLRQEWKNGINVLGVDVRCGTPLLKIKNFFQKNNISIIKNDTFFENPKYYEDLNTIADHCFFGTFESVYKYLDHKKYDGIFLGEPINAIEDYEDFIHKVIDQLNDGGFFIFPLENMFDFRALLNIIGGQEYNKEGKRVITYIAMLNMLKGCELDVLEMITEGYGNPNVEAFVKDVFNKIIPQEDTSFLQGMLMVDTIWFVIQKKNEFSECMKLKSESIGFTGLRAEIPREY